MPILPFEQLPAITPESALNEQFSRGRRQIQNKYRLQWDEVNRSAKFLGPAKTHQMYQQIDSSSRQELLQFDQRTQAQLAQLQRIDALAGQGLINNADEIKTRMVFGSDVAESMFPGRPSVEKQYGTLDIYADRIRKRLKDFKPATVKKPSIFETVARTISPVYGMYKLPKGRKIPKLEIWDYNVINEDGTRGKWMPASEGQISEYIGLLAEQQNIGRRRVEIHAQPGVSKRIVQPGTKGGSFSDKVAVSVKPSRPAKRPTQKIIRQRNRRTGQERISYDGGRTWQTVSG